jgi:hypothetical protein
MIESHPGLDEKTRRLHNGATGAGLFEFGGSYYLFAGSRE